MSVKPPVLGFHRLALVRPWIRSHMRTSPVFGLTARWMDTNVPQSWSAAPLTTAGDDR